ncbi:MAG: hypothetical protein AAGA77_24760 [Bacteroidota bacterium]
MSLVFDIKSQIPSENEVKHINFEKYYPNVNTSMKWKNLRLFVVRATNLFILKYIDRTIYDALLDDSQNSAIQDEVLELIKHTVAEYCVYLCLPKNITVISDIDATENTNQNTQPIG